MCKFMWHCDMQAQLDSFMQVLWYRSVLNLVCRDPLHWHRQTEVWKTNDMIIHRLLVKSQLAKLYEDYSHFVNVTFATCDALHHAWCKESRPIEQQHSHIQIVSLWRSHFERSGHMCESIDATVHRQIKNRSAVLRISTLLIHERYIGWSIPKLATSKSIAVLREESHLCSDAPLQPCRHESTFHGYARAKMKICFLETTQDRPGVCSNKLFPDGDLGLSLRFCLNSLFTVTMLHPRHSCACAKTPYRRWACIDH